MKIYSITWEARRNTIYVLSEPEHLSSFKVVKRLAWNENSFFIKGLYTGYIKSYVLPLFKKSPQILWQILKVCVKGHLVIYHSNG